MFFSIVHPQIPDTFIKSSIILAKQKSELRKEICQKIISQTENKFDIYNSQLFPT